MSISKRVAKKIRESNLRNYYAPIGSDGIVWNSALDDECERLYEDLQLEKRLTEQRDGEVNRIRKQIPEKQYDRIMSNSLDISNTTNKEAEILIRQINSNDYARLMDIHQADEHDYNLLKFKLPSSMETTWDSMFDALMKLRVKNLTPQVKDRGLVIDSAFSYGKPNQEVIHCQPNGGGCGLSALYAIGVISFDTFINLLCHNSTLDKNSGTAGNVLYHLALSNYKGDDILFDETSTKQEGYYRYKNIYRKIFEIDYGFSSKQNKKNSNLTIEDLRDEEVELMNQKQIEVLKVLVKFLNNKLEDDTATLLRFGDRKKGTRDIDETKFGHSVVVYKHKGVSYIADFWLSSKLTFQNATKNGIQTYSVSSWEQRAGGQLEAIVLLSVENLMLQMEEQNHARPCGTIFEVICCDTRCLVQSDFNRFKLELSPRYASLHRQIRPSSRATPQAPQATRRSSRLVSIQASHASPAPRIATSTELRSLIQQAENMTIDKKNDTMSFCTKAGICTVVALTAATLAYMGLGKTKRKNRKARKTKKN